MSAETRIDNRPRVNYDQLAEKALNRAGGFIYSFGKVIFKRILKTKDSSTVYNRASKAAEDFMSTAGFDKTRDSEKSKADKIGLRAEALARGALLLLSTPVWVVAAVIEKLVEPILYTINTIKGKEDHTGKEAFQKWFVGLPKAAIVGIGTGLGFASGVIKTTYQKVNPRGI